MVYFPPCPTDKTARPTTAFDVLAGVCGVYQSFNGSMINQLSDIFTQS